MSFDKVPLPSGSRFYQDPIDQLQEAWVPHGTSRWLRMKSKRGIDAKKLENVNLLPVSVHECIEGFRFAISNGLRSLFSESKQKLYMPDSDGRISSRKAYVERRLEDPYLIWSENEQLCIDQLKELLGGTFKSVQLGNSWLLHGEHGLQEKVAHEEICTLGAKLITELLNTGSIVFEKKPVKCKKICVLIKNYHGEFEMVEDLSKDTRFGSVFLTHQMAINNALNSIHNESKQRTQLFFESMPTHKIKNELEVFKQCNAGAIIDFQDLFEGINENTASIIFGKICDLIRKGDNGLAYRLYRRFTGDMRFLIETMRDGTKWEDRIYGMARTERDELNIQEKSIDDPEEARAIRYKDYIQTHEHLICALQKKCLDGSVGVVVLGGAHFKSGNQSNVILEDYSALEKIGAFCLEDFVSREKSLDDAHIIVFEPKHYAWLVGRMDIARALGKKVR